MLILLDILIISIFFSLIHFLVLYYMCKKINIKRKSKHNNSNSLKHKEKDSVLVKRYEFFRPDNKKIAYIIHKCARDWYKNILTGLCLDVYMILKGQTVILSMEYFLIKS